MPKLSELVTAFVKPYISSSEKSFSSSDKLKDVRRFDRLKMLMKEKKGILLAPVLL